MEETTYILNTPVLTDWGEYVFKEIDREKARRILEKGFISAVGHPGTAEVLTTLLGMEIPVNRVAIKMGVGDQAVVFRLLDRLPEGTVLSAVELSKLKYKFGLLTKTAD